MTSVKNDDGSRGARFRRQDKDESPSDLVLWEIQSDEYLLLIS